jgi:hypothetical protein
MTQTPWLPELGQMATFNAVGVHNEYRGAQVKLVGLNSRVTVPAHARCAAAPACFRWDVEETGETIGWFAWSCQLSAPAPERESHWLDDFPLVGSQMSWTFPSPWRYEVIVTRLERVFTVEVRRGTYQVSSPRPFATQEEARAEARGLAKAIILSERAREAGIDDDLSARASERVPAPLRAGTRLSGRQAAVVDAMREHPRGHCNIVPAHPEHVVKSPDIGAYFCDGDAGMHGARIDRSVLRMSHGIDHARVHTSGAGIEWRAASREEVSERAASGQPMHTRSAKGPRPRTLADMRQERVPARPLPAYGSLTMPTRWAEHILTWVNEHDGVVQESAVRPRITRAMERRGYIMQMDGEHCARVTGLGERRAREVVNP